MRCYGTRNHRRVSKMVLVVARRAYKYCITIALTLWVSSSSLAAVDFLTIADIRPGLKGVGRTVFSGSTVEEFQVEILGVLENAGPKQSIILARLSGGPLERTGVMQGMSGSPVYIGGKLA